MSSTSEIRGRIVHCQANERRVLLRNMLRISSQIFQVLLMLRIAQHKWTVCVLGMVILIITPRGGLFAATVNPDRKIAIFVDGTSLAQQRSIVTLLDPQVQI